MTTTPTGTQAPPGPSAPSVLGPSAGDRWRRARGPLVVAVVVLLGALVLALLATPSVRGTLRTDSPAPEGSLALATLLRERGVEVVPSGDLTAEAAGPGTTVLVAAPSRMSTIQRQALQRSGADLVLVAPDTATLRALAPGVVGDDAAIPETTEPGCPLRAAVAAGPVDLTDAAYTGPPGTTACYPVEDRPSAALVAVPGAARSVTVVGGAAPFTNAALADNGNAALALQLLGAHPRLAWYLPVPPPEAAGQTRTVPELLPPWVVWGAVQLLVAGVAVAVWRGRRLGPLVSETLPVVVPAGETVRGRARLYRRTGARARAAAVLRGRARRDLAARLGLPPTAPAAAVAAAVVERAPRAGPSAAQVHDLLDGPEPPDDTALVALADGLDQVTAAVARA